MSNLFHDMSADDRHKLLDVTFERIQETIGADNHFALIVCSLDSNGDPEEADLTSTLEPETFIDLIGRMHRSRREDGPTTPRPMSPQEMMRGLARTSAKTDQMWAEMRSHHSELVQMVMNHPTANAKQRLVRDCLALVVAEVQERMRAE